nr:transcriptional activator TAF-1 [Ipomoea batatas]
MGNSEEGKSSKPEKSSSTTPDQGNAQMYLDWAAIQAYYGPRVAIPPYFNSAVPPGHAPHPYMWGPPQPMMPPYGAPYAAIYAHGGVYAHPGVPIGSHSHGHEIPPSGAINEATAAASMGTDTSGKSSGNADRGLMSKLKGFDGLGMSIGNGNSDGGKGGTDHTHSQSMETEGSSDGSNADTVGENTKKRSRETTPTNADKTTNGYPTSAGEFNGASKKLTPMTIPPILPGQVMGTVVSPNMTTSLDLRSPPSANLKASPTNVPQLSPTMPTETWAQNERELKREKRKQSNRESARRSRLRKQAETEELAKRVQSLTSENINLKSEINKLTENSEKLKLENVALMVHTIQERLKAEKLGQMEEISLGKIDEKKRLQPVATADLLARVNNSDSVDRNGEEDEVYDSNSSRTKLHQLLDASPRTDAVAAR